LFHPKRWSAELFGGQIVSARSGFEHVFGEGENNARDFEGLATWTAQGYKDM